MMTTARSGEYVQAAAAVLGDARALPQGLPGDLLGQQVSEEWREIERHRAPVLAAVRVILGRQPMKLTQFAKLPFQVD